MNPKILNREGKLAADGWYNIEANGEHINHESRCVLVIDDKARESITNRFSTEAAKAGPDFPGQFVDRDHLSQSMENPTEAYGWAMEIRNRGVLEARVDWTGLGLPLVESKDGRPPAYKFFSTEYDQAECEKIGTRIINRKVYDVLRPLRLDGLSLTNDPNNKGQRPISNRKGNPAGAAEKETPVMKNLLKELGLAEDASEESAVAVARQIKNRATSAETERDTLKKERDELLESQVEADLEKYAPVIKNRDSWKKRLIANRKDTIAMLEDLNVEAAGGDDKETEKRQITNRASATPPAGGKNPSKKDDDADEKRAQKIANRARELRAADRTLNINRSYELAEAEIGETGAK